MKIRTCQEKKARCGCALLGRRRTWTGLRPVRCMVSLPSSVHGSPRNPRGRVRSLSLTSDDSAVPVLRHARCRGILRSLCRRRAPTSRYSHPRLPFLLCETEHPNPNLVLLFDAMMPTRLLILQAFLAKQKTKKSGVDTHLHLPLLGSPLGHIIVCRGHTC